MQAIDSRTYPIRPIWLLRAVMPLFIVMLFILFIFIVFGIIVQSDFSFSEWLWMSLLILIIPMIAYLLILGWWRFTFRFKVTQDGIEFSQGLVLPARFEAKWSRIVGVEVKQSAADRYFRIANLKIKLSGNDNSMFKGNFLNKMWLGFGNVRHKEFVDQYIMSQLGYNPYSATISISGLSEADASSMSQVIKNVGNK